MKKVLFIDRDGTIIVEPEDGQIDSFAKLTFLASVISNLKKIAQEFEYELVMVTNQDGLGTDSFPEDTFWPVQNMMINILEGEGVIFDKIFIDRTFLEDNLPTRKPGTEMLKQYVYGNYDLEHSFVIGDRESDLQLAKNLGCKGILITRQTSKAEAGRAKIDLVTDNWNEIYNFLKNKSGRAHITRKTNETDIEITLNIYGTGKCQISTGLLFFDHMLEQLSKHGNFDINIKVNGDLAVDEHHTIEDVAITLGQAFTKALSSKKGIERYGFMLPMDDCLAQVAIDFGGRPWLVWEADFKREMIGNMPTEMFSHFFKSFSDYAECNLNIKAEGVNEHHKIESIFKAFARSLKMAAQRTENMNIPSTKGSL